MTKKLNTFQRVRELQGWQAVAFATTLVERMQPNYALFCQVTEYADPAQFRNTLDLVWERLAHPKSKINFAVQIDKIESLTPDPADYDSFGVFPAVDAAISLVSVLQLLNQQEPQGAVITSKLSQGCVEAFIEATEEGELTAADIKQHPLMQWEISFQQELIERVNALSSGPEAVKQLKKMATEDGVSNIGLARDEEQ